MCNYKKIYNCKKASSTVEDEKEKNTIGGDPPKKCKKKKYMYVQKPTILHISESAHSCTFSSRSLVNANIALVNQRSVFPFQSGHFVASTLNMYCVNASFRCSPLPNALQQV